MECVNCLSILILVFSPILASVAILLPKFPNHEVKIRRFAKTFAATHFVYALLFLLFFDAGSYAMSFEKQITIFGSEWVKALGISASFALDGISLTLCLLVSFVIFVVLFLSKHYIRYNTRLYYALILAVETAVIGLFASRDIFLFLLFMEIAIIPIYFLITRFSAEESKKVALRYVFTALCASSFLMFGMLILYFYNFAITNVLSANIEIMSLDEQIYPLWFQLMIFMCFFLGFVPVMGVFPFHKWFVDVNEKASIPVSILVSVIPPLTGLYGLIRFNLSIFPQIFKILAPFVVGAAVFSCVYACLVLLKSFDLKKIFSYYGVYAASLAVLGIASMSIFGIQGALYEMIVYSICITGALSTLGIILAKSKSARLTQMENPTQFNPACSSFMRFFMFAAFGIPFLGGFPAIVMILTGCFNSPLDSQLLMKLAAVVAVVATFVLAAGLVRNYNHIFFSKAHSNKQANTEQPHKIAFSQICVLFSVALCLIYLGTFPSGVLSIFQTATNVIINLIGI